MSVKIMAQVFENFNIGGNLKLLALRLADCAHESGENIFIGVAELARTTQQSERAVQYQLRQLQSAAIGFLQLTAEAVYGAPGKPGRPRTYRIDPEFVAGRRQIEKPAGPEQGAIAEQGAKVAPCFEPEKQGANARTGCKIDPEQGATAIAPEPKEEPKDKTLLSPDFAEPEDREREEDLRLAHWMLERIRAIYPKARTPNMTAWANDVRLIRKAQQCTHRDIAALFKACNEDEFWRANVLSPHTLKRRWMQLWLKFKIFEKPDHEKPLCLHCHNVATLTAGHRHYCEAHYDLIER